MDEHIQKSCPSCAQKDLFVFFGLKGVPIQSVLNIPTRNQALSFPRGDMALGFCDNCGFISNVLFEHSYLKYSSEYESTQSYSPTYNAFARHQAKQLIDRHRLYGKELIEIGCGNGEFLALLCELGNNRGIGFDPAYKEGRLKREKNLKVRFIKNFYNEQYAEYHADFVFCRMTLEHIPASAEFISMVRRSIINQPDVIVFFQVPNVTRILRDCAFEDLYYEHCSYFSPGSLARLFRNCGFDVMDIHTDYDDQYIMIDAQPCDDRAQVLFPAENDLSQLRSLVKSFPGRFKEKYTNWKNQLDLCYKNGRKVVLWGSGSKGVSFLTTLDNSDNIEYVVDVNPYRQGTFMAGTGQEIVSPSFLKSYKPDVVIVMNAVYKDEISGTLKQLGLFSEILTL